MATHRANDLDAVGVCGLSKQLGGRDVLRQVDLQITAGEAVAVMGDNGAGKTTLLRCLAGLLRADAGRISWRRENLDARRVAVGSIGYVAHANQLYPRLTLLENLVFAARMHRLAEPASAARAWLTQAGLAAHVDSFPRQVSQGMRKKTSILRGIIHQPALLLLDEPFAGLDQGAQRWLTELFVEQKAKRRCICFTTHDRQRAATCADRIFHLAHGQLFPRSDLPEETTIGVPQAA